MVQYPPGQQSYVGGGQQPYVVGGQQPYVVGGQPAVSSVGSPQYVGGGGYSASDGSSGEMYDPNHYTSIQYLTILGKLEAAAVEIDDPFSGSTPI